MRRSPEAEELWASWYMALDDDVSGMYGAVTARAEAQVLRLSVAYALTGPRPEPSKYSILKPPYALAVLRQQRPSISLHRRQETRPLTASSRSSSRSSRPVSTVRSNTGSSRVIAPARGNFFEAHAGLVEQGLAEEVTDNSTGGRPRHVLFANGTSEESEDEERPRRWFRKFAYFASSEKGRMTCHTGIVTTFGPSRSYRMARQRAVTSPWHPGWDARTDARLERQQLFLLRGRRAGRSVAETSAIVGVSEGLYRMWRPTTGSSVSRRRLRTVRR